MDRHLFHEANWIYSRIKKEEEKNQTLYGLKDQVKTILEGHVEIPEEEVYALFNQIDKLCGYVKKGIEEAYQQIDKL